MWDKKYLGFVCFVLFGFSLWALVITSIAFHYAQQPNYHTVACQIQPGAYVLELKNKISYSFCNAPTLNYQLVANVTYANNSQVVRLCGIYSNTICATYPSSAPQADKDINDGECGTLYSLSSTAWTWIVPDNQTQTQDMVNTTCQVWLPVYPNLVYLGQTPMHHEYISLAMGIAFLIVAICVSGWATMALIYDNQQLATNATINAHEVDLPALAKNNQETYHLLKATD